MKKFIELKKQYNTKPNRIQKKRKVVDNDNNS